jgi:uncharacterized protein YoxC
MNEKQHAPMHRGSETTLSDIQERLDKDNMLVNTIHDLVKNVETLAMSVNTVGNNVKDLTGRFDTVMVDYGHRIAKLEEKPKGCGTGLTAALMALSAAGAAFFAHFLGG